MAKVAARAAAVTHAEEDADREFYRRYQFDPWPINEFHLCLLMKDIRAAVGE